MKLANLILKLIRYFHKKKIISSKFFISMLHYKIFKNSINWTNININLRLKEKIQIYKITIKKNPLINIITDKINVRNYIKNKVNISFP